MASLKKLIVFICVIAMALTLCACGNSAKPVHPSPENVPEDIQTEPVPDATPDATPDKTPGKAPDKTPAPGKTGGKDKTPRHPEDEAFLNREGTVYEPAEGILGAGVAGTSGPGVFKVSIVGAEFFRSADDKEAVRIYYDVTSYASWIIDAADVSIQAAQDNDYLWSIDRTADSPVPVQLSHSDIRGGVTVRCAREFECSWNGGPIYVESWYFMTWSHLLDEYVYDGAESVETGLFDDSLIARFDPSEMPARPASEVTPVPIADPDWLSGVPGEGSFDFDEAYLTFDGAEFFRDGDRNVVRIYVSYKNIDDRDGCYLNFAPELRVMQDGIELWPYEGDVRVPEDDNVQAAVSPDETVRVAREYVLLSLSPVTCEFHDFGMSKPEIAAVYQYQAP